MGLESQFGQPAQEPPLPPQEDGQVDTAFTEDGLLNRSFGKDPGQPSEARFFEGGILNRPVFNRIADAVESGMSGVARSPEDERKLQALRFKLGMDAEFAVAQQERLEDEADDERAAAVSEDEAEGTNEVQNDQPDLGEVEAGQVTAEVTGDKPLYQTFLDIHGGDERAAFDDLYSRFEPGLSPDQIREHAQKIMREYQLYKDGKDWKNIE